VHVILIQNQIKLKAHYVKSRMRGVRLMSVVQESFFFF